MPLRTLIAALVFAVVCGTAAAADVTGYGEAFDTLFSVDLTTHTAVKIGQATLPGLPRLANLEGLTFAPSGALYAVSDGNSAKVLLQIDPATGLATVLGTLNLTGGNTSGQLDLGMTATCDGRLWLSSGTGLLWQVDPATATATFIGNLGAKITGLAARGNTLFGAGSQGGNNLYTIDLTTGQATLVGAYGSGVSYITTTSPGFDATGQLWAVLGYVPPETDTSPIPEWSDLAKLNTASGTLTNTGPITGSVEFRDDFYGNLKGLALTNACVAGGAVAAATVSLPALSWQALLALIVLLALFARVQFSRR